MYLSSGIIKYLGMENVVFLCGTEWVILRLEMPPPVFVLSQPDGQGTEGHGLETGNVEEP